jgi:hypothetical protein
MTQNPQIQSADLLVAKADGYIVWFMFIRKVNTTELNHNSRWF